MMAQLKNFHLDLVLRLRSKIQKVHPTMPEHFSVKTYPARCHYCQMQLLCRGADKSLARPRRKQTTATEDFDFHISYL